jgi:outer membrane protein, heavy metal efflux system
MPRPITLLLIMFALTSPAGSADLTTTRAPSDCDAPPQAEPLTEGIAMQRLDACNRDVIAARRAVTAAMADRRIAGQPPNPTLTAGVGSYNPQLGIGSGPWSCKTVDTALRYEQLIERGGKLALRELGADRLIAAAEQDLAEIRRQQGTAVLQAMVDLAAADERVTVLGEVAVLYDEITRANARRVGSGDLAPIDAQRQAIETMRAQADLRQARADAQRARLALASALGWDAYASRLKCEPSVLGVSPLPADLVDPGARADVKAARLRVDAAAAARDLARAQAQTDVTVGVQVDRYPSNATNTFGQGTTYGVTVSVPLPIRHAYEGEQARAYSDYDAAQESYRRIVAGAQNDATRMQDDLAAAQSRLQLLQEQIAPQSEQVARAAELGYAKGALGVLDVLDARRVLRQTRLDILSARADVARAAAARNRWIASQTE